MIKYWVIILLLAVSSLLKAQVLSDFTARQNGEHVELKWTFNSGETCDGTYVRHGLNSTVMKTIHHVPGICGAPEQEISYSFVHEDPAPNDTNYYSLILGTRGNSSTISVYVNDIENGFMINGQPLNDHAEIVLSEQYQKGAEILIFDMNGQKKYQQTVATKRKTLYRESLNSGMHIVIVRYKTGKTYRQKLMVF
ncbi:MAG: T9SS type A sorting domain-containing protein [Bacteroidota bacterium]